MTCFRKVYLDIHYYLDNYAHRQNLFAITFSLKYIIGWPTYCLRFFTVPIRDAFQVCITQHKNRIEFLKLTAKLVIILFSKILDQGYDSVENSSKSRSRRSISP